MKKFFLFTLALLAFVACTHNDVEELAANRADVPETLTVGFEGDDTRIQLNEAQKTVWNRGDNISVFYRSDANQKWQFQGETGDRQGQFKRTQNAESNTSIANIVVAYPYSEEYFLNTKSYNIEATLPAVQHYAEGSYGIGDNLMVAQSKFTQFSLKNVCGWLRVQLTGNGEKVTHLTLKGNNDEQLAGLVYVDTTTAEATLVAEMGSFDDVENGVGGGLVPDNSLVKSVTLDCGEGVELGEEATSFYFAVPPQTFEGGVTVVVECVGYEPMVLSTTAELVIERNHIKPMDIVEFESEVGPDVYFEAKTLNGGYYGKQFSPGYNYFIILSINGTTGFSDLYLDTYYRFDIFSATPAGDPLTLPVGVYEFDKYSLGTAGTFGFEYSKREEISEDGTYEMNYIIGGTITVTENRIEAMVTLDDGKLHKVVYEGGLELGWTEVINEPPYSRLEKDYTFEYNTAMMRLFYYGDLYNVGGVNWTIQFTDDANTFNGDYFSLDLVSDNLLATAEGIVGTYTAVADENSVAKSTFIAGTEGNKTGQYYNSWYWVLEEGVIIHSKGAPISKGTISITKDGNSYVVTLDTEDDNGHKVTGSYTCQDVEFYDRTNG